MERKLKLVLAYDGTAFHGWQRSAGVRTVQAEVEATLQRILRHPLHVDGASRTDAGVHARGQVATVVTTAEIPVHNLYRAIGHHLPDDVALVHIEEVPAAFHPSRDALDKLYTYRMHNRVLRPVATQAGSYGWHVWYALDLGRMRAGAEALVGKHDFAAFASQGSPRASTVRTIRRLEVQRRGDDVMIHVVGDGFLYNQVRNMVGTLYEVGRGHWPAERVGEILASGERRNAGITAPAHGLCLRWIRYAPK